MKRPVRNIVMSIPVFALAFTLPDARMAAIQGALAVVLFVMGVSGIARGSASTSPHQGLDANEARKLTAAWKASRNDQTIYESAINTVSSYTSIGYSCANWTSGILPEAVVKRLEADGFTVRTNYIGGWSVIDWSETKNSAAEPPP